jgi:hypothetical protein
VERDDLVIQVGNLIEPVTSSARRADVVTHRLMMPDECGRSLTQWRPGDEIQLRQLKAQLGVNV